MHTMLRLQLITAIFLAFVGLLSLALYLANARSGSVERQVQLPFTTTEALDGNDEGQTDSGAGPDPLDVTQAEDVIEGDPLDEAKFWTEVRLRKLVIAVVLLVVLVIQGVSLGHALAHGCAEDIAEYALHVSFALCALAIAAPAVSQSESAAHSSAIIHLSVLSTLAVAALGVVSILPDTRVRTWAVTVPFMLYSVVCAVAVSTRTGPHLHYPPERIYPAKTVASITQSDPGNVCGVVGASVLSALLFAFTTKVVMFANTAESLDISDLPIVPVAVRATYIFSIMRMAHKRLRLRSVNIFWLKKVKVEPGSGIELAWRLLRVNWRIFGAQAFLAVVAACMCYIPAFFLRKLVRYLETDMVRTDRGWGWVWCAGLFFSNALYYLLTAQLWSLAYNVVQVRLRIQLNTSLYAKALVRKDVASSAATPTKAKDDNDNGKNKVASGSTVSSSEGNDKKEDNGPSEFSSKAQVMTLMTSDIDRISQFALQLWEIIDPPIEIIIGSIFLYNLLGVSCFIGLAVSCLFLPLNHFAGKIVLRAQENLMSARDERMSLMNEVLGAIRTLKFMAWERSFEARVLKVRARELKYQRLNYMIETAENALWDASPLVVILVSFWHFTVISGGTLTPSIAFTSISIFMKMKIALNVLPWTIVSMLQSLVSLRRIEKYLDGVEVAPVPPLSSWPSTIAPARIAFQSATVTWPQRRGTLSSSDSGSVTSSAGQSASSTPRHKFILMDLTIEFPGGELSLVCGKLGSGKTLMLLALLGEADILAGQLSCPSSPPDSLARLAKERPAEKDWIVEGLCAFVPQSAWLRNASIKDNILFNLPYIEERYRKTLEVCALVNDLNILEDGDDSEVGERGVNLSGGQNARVSLARAVYSRASVLLLDDVPSAVDAHTAHHLYTECLKGELMRGRTVILVSHYVQLCAPGAKYIVALDNGRVQFTGDNTAFQASVVIRSLVQSSGANVEDDQEKVKIPATSDDSLHKGGTKDASGNSKFETSSTAAPSEPEKTEKEKAEKKQSPRKLVEAEKRAVGRIGMSIWLTYIKACGGKVFWAIFLTSLLLATVTPVLENGWIRIWSRAADTGDTAHGPEFYIAIYAAVTILGLALTTLRYLILYVGSIHASTVLYERLLETVLFAQIRFHDTVSRGRLLNRFGQDFEGIDGGLANNFGRSIIYALNVITTLATITFVEGWPFFIASVFIGALYFRSARVYSRPSRELRRLSSVTRSPLYSLYGETISGVTVLRAFGASSKFMRDMLCCVDTNANPVYWMWGLTRWLSIRFNLLSSLIVGLTGLLAILTPSIDASLAGFALAFASTVTGNIFSLVRTFAGLEQSMVAVERVKEYSELQTEPPEFVEPRPPREWPASGSIQCEGLTIRYAPELPNVLHGVDFSVNPGEKVGILGRTGSGKSTLALSFFRFVEATEGRIIIDGVDISKIGLNDLRSKLTIIPQDPMILSGTLRSTLDVFDEYHDAEIVRCILSVLPSPLLDSRLATIQYEALCRVHLIPSSEDDVPETDGINSNVFRNLDSPVSEGGENFSTGEKQLLCMARAILKRSKVLVMDEATASVDYGTDELIGKTIRQEFAQSTLLTIAHRLRTVIDYDRVMVLDEGRMVEFDRPATLLADSKSRFYALCKATGTEEFGMLRKMAAA